MQRLLSVAAFAAMLASGVAHAQDAGALERAENAYQEIDFEGVRTHAIEALRNGGLEPAQLARVYELLGVASSALGDADGARDYFVRMLWLDPDAQLDESVSPRMREPYLEARGIRMARPGTLEVETGIDRGSSQVHVTLRDPSDMGRRVRVAARIEGDTEYTTHEYEAQTELAANLDGADTADRIEYFVQVLDRHGNVILAEGGPFAPRVVGRQPGAAASEESGGGGGGGGASITDDPAFWPIVLGIVGGLVLVGGGIAIGVVVDQRSRIGVQSSVAFGFD